MITDAGTDYTLPFGSYYMEYCGCSEEIDRPRSGNHTESETRSRDFPWVSSTTNDPAAVPWMLLQLGSRYAYFDVLGPRLNSRGTFPSIEGHW